MRIIVAISGSSAPIYGIWLLRALHRIPGIEKHLIISEGAIKTIEYEAPEWTLQEVISMADVVHDNRNLAASISSGSFKTNGMVVAPCSMKTLAGIACSFSTNLILRAADVCLKERRKLILVTRETPLHRGHLENMLRVTEMGGIILPPVPAFYHRPKSIEDILNQTTGKILDQLGIEHDLFNRWRGIQ